jgi:type IV secretion system protein TrbL
MRNLIDVVLEGGKGIVRWISEQFMDGLRTGYETLGPGLFGTPTPETAGPFVFGAPTNDPWISIREALVGGEIMLLSLLLLVVCIQGRHTIRIFNIGSSYAAQKSKKTAWEGVFLILTWYWIALTAFYLVDGLTIALIPNFETLLQVLQGFLQVPPSNAMLMFLLALVGGIAMWALEALLYIRDVLLYLSLYGMPLAIALAYANLPVVSTIALGFCKQFIPLLVMPLPAAVLLKVYDLLYTGADLTPPTAFFKSLIAVSLPVLALWVAWQTFKYAAPLSAGAIGTATKGAALVGGVAAGTYLGSAGFALTAAQKGPKAATGYAVAETTKSLTEKSQRTATQTTKHDPGYRRTENEPGPQ